MNEFLNNIMLLPFVVMLLTIAIMPIKAEHFWESNKNKLFLAIGLSLPVIIFLLFQNKIIELEHILLFDYIPFIILIGTLFIITGGIHIGSSLDPHPKVNISILIISAILASFIGTTGISMLMIRPLIRINQNRRHKTHTILFFIAIAANCGGLLTPIGDPPLFMMYLRGTDFFWFLNLFKEWFVVNFILILIYTVIELKYWKKDEFVTEKREEKRKHYIKIEGYVNIFLLILVVLTIALVNSNNIELIKMNKNYGFIREAILVLLSLISLFVTNKQIHLKNHFNWEPIEEVAYLFLGIFVTMAPVLSYIANNASKFPVRLPFHFYYTSGFLSSFLDNTPTAVTFYSLSKSLVDNNILATTSNMVSGIPSIFMQAICLGAVFFGAMTYIGNGPNFMIKSIAEKSGIKMPHFFEYIYKFSLIILLPAFIIAQLIFL